MFENHILDKKSDTHYRIYDPKLGGINSFHVIFIANRIIVTGDYSPNINGCISDVGYGFEWFISPKSKHYLCSKFAIRKCFSVTRCIDDLKSLIGDFGDHECDDDCSNEQHLIQNAIEDLESGVISNECELQDFHSEVIDIYAGIPGYGYCENDEQFLWNIHEKFVELISKK